MKATWVRPSGVTRVGSAILYTGMLVLTPGLMTMDEVRGLGILLVACEFLAVQGLGLGVRVDHAGLVIRSLISERHIAHDRVIGITTDMMLSVRVCGGVGYATGLRPTILPMDPELLASICAGLARPGDPSLRVLQESDLHALWRPNNPDLTPEAVAPERWRFSRPTWWQLALHGAFVIAVGAAIVRG